ncbi:IS30 family transposase [Mycobacterium tuberculosis]|uniref:IS30 family transposase n=1 Tax=Mycobacterium tuberculosis TaxID=1773 RepID=UPI0009310A61|nr:IS30 family transposase [Mycobacterium tuberculosis]
MRQISSRYLSEEERINIADLRRSGLSIRKIADQLGRAPSTVSRELRRNSRRDGQYRPFEAHRWAVQRRVRRHRRRIDKNPDLCELIAELLAQRWSPQQIARHLRRKYPDDRSMWLCHESIYQAVYQPQSRLIRPPQVKSPHRGPLRTGRTHRRAHLRPGRRRPRFAQPMLSIHQRPFDPADRSEPGHWEGDLIVGKNQGSAIGTLVERQTRLIRLLHLPTHDAYCLRIAITETMSDLPVTLVRSITWDQGIEMARHIDITADLGAPVYFCDSRSPWQRASNENSNGLLRQYFPKGTSLSTYTPDHLRAVEYEINNRPCQVLGHRSPAELFTALLTSPDHQLLRR